MYHAHSVEYSSSSQILIIMLKMPGLENNPLEG